MAFVYVDAHLLSLPRAQQAARNYAAAVSLKEIREPPKKGQLLASSE